MPRKIPFHRPKSPAVARTREVINADYDRSKRDPGGKRFYGSRAWTELRRIKLSRDPFCERCPEREGLNGWQFTPATTVHHRIERSARPDLALDLDNLESLCAACHNRHHKGK